jgi:hypothetical protein
VDFKLYVAYFVMGIRIRSVEGRNPLCDKLQYVHTWTFVGC